MHPPSSATPDCCACTLVSLPGPSKVCKKLKAFLKNFLLFFMQSLKHSPPPPSRKCTDVVFERALRGHSCFGPEMLFLLGGNAVAIWVP